MSKNIIYIPAILHDQRSRDQKYEYSIKGWESWANKHNVDVVVNDQLIHKYDYMKPTWQRYYVLEILENSGIDYDQVLLIDADTMPHPDCPNFFELTEHKYAVTPFFGTMDWLLRSIENHAKFVFNDQLLPFWDYFNGGFQIVNRKHRDILSNIIKWYIANRDLAVDISTKFGTGTDQTFVNYLVRGFGAEVKMLSPKFNSQDLPRREGLNNFVFEKFVWVAHFNCWPKPNPGHWLEATYKRWWENK